MSYTDVFGNNTLPPAEYGYSALAITVDTTVVWPYNSSDSTALSKIVDITCAAGNTLTLPDATQASVGEDVLFRNVGANTLIVKDADGVQVTTVAAGAATYLYLTDNTTSAGVWGVIAFGVGTSTVDASSLVGYGIKAIGSSLNQSHPTLPTSTGITLDATHRAKLVVFTGGNDTFSLTSAATLGDDWFALIRNAGTGSLTLDGSGSETIDGQTTMTVQPGESLLLICTGTAFYSVGYGRSIVYQFTQLTKDVSAGGTITLTASEASNKLITFTGNPAADVTVIAPAVVAVYYTYSNISTAHNVLFKTAAGTTVSITQNSRIIAICDGTDMLSAQSAVANSSLSLTDGNVAAPSLYFATQTNTGLYKYGASGLGVAVNGVLQGYFDTNGFNGVLGGTTPNGASVTSLTASGTVTGAGFTNYFASPPALGATAPSTGKFTTLEATGNVTLSGGTANGVPYLNGSKVLTTGSAITYNGTTFAVGGEFSAANGAGGNASAKLASGNSSAVFDRTSAAGNAQFNFNGTQVGQIAALSGGGLEFYYGSSPTLGMSFGSGGELSVGAAFTSGHKLRSKSSTSDNSTFGLYVTNSSNTVLFYARSDGAMATGLAAASPYNNTTASAANCVIESGAGVLQRSTSARKYKTDIRDLPDLNVDLLRPVVYKSRCAGDNPDQDYYGLIADEADEAGFATLVNYGANGEVEGFQYERLTAVLLKEIQSLRKRVAALEAK